MLIWILAIFLFGLVAALGWFQGAVRLVVSLIGLFLGVFLAIPLAPAIKPLVVMTGLNHPLWSWGWAALFVFLIIFLVFSGLSFVVHHKVYLFYKYRTDDLTWLRWERMNKAIGACLGVVMGAVWLVVIGVIINVVGYFTVQVASDDTSSTTLRLVTQGKKDLRSSGLEPLVSKFDPASPKYYQAADVIGLIYNNPLLLGRLATYPPFLSYGEKPEFQEIAKDTDYNNLLMSKGDFASIFYHAQTQALLRNVEIFQDFLQQDLVDLYTFLKTGKSPKYDDEKILGKWELDLYATVAQERKKHPDMSASEMIRLRKMMKELSSAITLTATIDQKTALKVSLPQAPAAQPAAAAPTEAAAPTMDPTLAARYGVNYGRRSGTPAAAPRPAAPAPAQASATPLVLQASGQGGWKRDGDKYTLTFQTPQNGEKTAEAEVDEDRLIVTIAPNTIVFDRVD